MVHGLGAAVGSAVNEVPAAGQLNVNEPEASV
jgi:hypothetical protein